MFTLRVLGGSEVSLGERPLEGNRDWDGSQSAQLVKALLALGPRKTPRDVIIEALWLQALPSSAENNFKVALHRLRRFLVSLKWTEFWARRISVWKTICWHLTHSCARRTLPVPGRVRARP